MSRRTQIARVREIAQVAAKHGFGYAFERRPRGGGDGEPDMSLEARGRHLREMLDELGPTFVKFGQLLSTRPDIVPPDIVAELQKLQDDVRPVAYAEIERTIQAELGLTIEQAFLEFDEVPTAAASIGQVHRAVLPNGDRVAVKVQRPNAPRQIESDLALLNQAARLAKERVRALDFIDAEQLIDEFARSIRLELDYRAEARNAEAFHRNFAGDETVRIPRVYWSYTRERVLVLELLVGVQLADIDVHAMSEAARRELVYRIAETWMTMIFRHGFFHADPHPANVFVLAGGTIGLVDFGQAGKLTEEDISRLTRLFIDAANERVDMLPRRVADIGVRYPREREEEFAAELQDVYYRYYGVSLAEVDPMAVVREAFELIYRLNLRLPTRFVLLDKAIATLASVGIEIYPDFNVFEVAKPYARSLMIERFSPQRLFSRAQKESSELAYIAAAMPRQIHDFLEEVRDGQIEVGFVHKGLDEFMHKVDVAFNRLVVALVVVGGLIGSSLIGIFSTHGPYVAGVNFLSFIGFLLSGALGIWLLWGVIGSGRLR
jgi:ubiquinone biosynthesis protein